MSIQIPYPNITAEEPKQQLREMKAYLYRLADQLNFALEALERSKPGTAGEKH